ncbi:MAG: tRNA (N6-threonylcarbamoyladenosine(37)-N6)-methyltransferase TrmO, partial [Bdellovibrionota bacterium]
IWPEKCAILLGNERFGIEPSLLEEADHVVRIPMYGKKNSLNVGIALGIALNDRRQSKTSSRIGTFSSTAIHPYDVSRQASVTESGEIACIELAKGFDFEQAVKDLEGFDRIWLVYRFHQNKSWKPMVVPPRGPRTKRGVFATRSPYRPNSIGISCVELVKADGLKIFVRSHDLLDGTPILDVKPYLPYADSFPDAKIGWLSGLEELAHKIDFSEDAKADLAWLEARGVQQIETFIRSQLTFDPLDDSRKRVRPLDPQNFPNRFELAYRTWRIQFDHSEDRSAVYVLKMTSGYSTEDLASRDDKYLDKEVHRAFIAR